MQIHQNPLLPSRLTKILWPDGCKGPEKDRTERSNSKEGTWFWKGLEHITTEVAILARVPSLWYPVALESVGGHWHSQNCAQREMERIFQADSIYYSILPTLCPAQNI